MTEAAAVGPDLLVDGRAVLTRMGFLVGDVAEVLQFYVEVIGPEYVAEVKEGLGRVGISAGVDQIAHLAVTAAGEADEFRGMGAQ